MFLIAAFLLVSTSVAAAEIYCFQDDGGASYYTNVPGPGRARFHPPPVGGKKHAAKGKDGASARHIEAYEPAIASASRHFAVDPDVIRAVIKAESNYNEQAVSPKGALGLMQLMPATAREMGVGDVFDPVQNIHGGARYLSGLLGALQGDLPLALAAYNAGPSRVFGQNRIPPIRETRSYVGRVLKVYNNLKGGNSL